MAEPAVDNQESYRTRQDEESDSQEKKKIRFADISLTAAWIAASYQAYSPEQIRKDIQQEWVSKVTKEISKDQKFKAVYATRQRGEDRHAYDSRRIQQIEIRRAVSDLVSAHGDQLFEKGAGTTANLRETLGELINSDYQNLQANRLDLINQISKTQAELAEGFSQQNEKNNRRFKEAETLETIKNQEKAEHHAKVLTRRELKEELSTLTDKKQRDQAVAQSQLSQKALARVLASQDISNLDEEKFLQAFKIELNRELYNKRGRKRYEIDDISKERILKMGRYYSRYFSQVPASTLPQLPKKQANQTISQPQTTTSLNIKANWPKWQFSLPKIDFSGLSSLFRSGAPTVYESISGFMGNFSGFLSKLPGIGGFFGGSVGAGVAGAGAATGGAAAARGFVAAAPIILIIGIGGFLLLVILLGVFNNPVAQPQALIQTTLTPTP